jgi:hypothetical protein
VSPIFVAIGTFSAIDKLSSISQNCSKHPRHHLIQLLAQNNPFGAVSYRENPTALARAANAAGFAITIGSYRSQAS